MKSQAKVKQQRRIKNIPGGMGFRVTGLINRILGNTQITRKERKKIRKNSVRAISRRMNRSSR